MLCVVGIKANAVLPGDYLWIRNGEGEREVTSQKATIGGKEEPRSAYNQRRSSAHTLREAITADYTLSSGSKKHRTLEQTESFAKWLWDVLAHTGHTKGQPLARN